LRFEDEVTDLLVSQKVLILPCRPVVLYVISIQHA